MMPSNYMSCFQKEYDRNINTIATALTNGKQWPKEDMAFVFSALSELKALSEALHKRLDLQSFKLQVFVYISYFLKISLGVWVFSRPKKVEGHSVSEKTLQEVLKWLQSNTPKINDIMNRSAMSQESEDGKMLVSENSNRTEVEETSEKKNHNEETGESGDTRSEKQESKRKQ